MTGFLFVAMMFAGWSNARRKDLREGSGHGTGDDHFYQLEGSNRLSIFIGPKEKMKGYYALKDALETEGCEVVFPAPFEQVPGSNYNAIRITRQGEIIPSVLLKRAHRWAHQRNCLHSFFKPMFQPVHSE
jgi:hypothetical protein